MKVGLGFLATGRICVDDEVHEIGRYLAAIWRTS